MDQPPRPTRREDVDLDSDEFSWIIDSRRSAVGIMDKIKDCYIAGVDMTQFYEFGSRDYKIPKFQEALDKKRGVYKAPQAAPPRPSRGRSSSLPPPEGDDTSSRRQRREKSAPPPVSYIRRDDPVTDKTNDMVVVAMRIKNGENPAGDTNEVTRNNAKAVFGLALPRTVVHVYNLMKASTHGYTLPENTPQALGQYFCDCAEKCPFYTELQIIDVKAAIHRGVLAPDGLGDACGTCAVCLNLASALDNIAANGPNKRKRAAQARKDYQCPPENRNRDNVAPSLILHHTIYRVADELLKLEREKLEGVEGEALVDLLRPRAVYFCEERQEAARRAGAMSDWRPGLRAALLARRSGLIFTERSTSEQYNNSRRFLALRGNEGHLQATGKKPYQR